MQQRPVRVSKAGNETKTCGRSYKCRGNGVGPSRRGASLAPTPAISHPRHATHSTQEMGIITGKPGHYKQNCAGQKLGTRPAAIIRPRKTEKRGTRSVGGLILTVPVIHDFQFQNRREETTIPPPPATSCISSCQLQQELRVWSSGAM